MNKNQIIYSSMIELGLTQLGRAVVEVTFDYNQRPLAAPLAILDCISATELIIRGRILEVESIKAEQGSESMSDIRLQQLAYGSRSFRFDVLPEQLFRSTGYSIKKIDQYQSFGNLRKLICRKYFEREVLIETTLRYAYEIIEPMIIQFWNELIIVRAPEYDFEADQYIDQYLNKSGIPQAHRTSDEYD